MEAEIKHHWLDEKAQIIIPLDQYNALKNQWFRHTQFQKELSESNSAILEQKIKEINRLVFDIDQDGDLSYSYNLDLETHGLSSNNVISYEEKMEELADILVFKYQDLIYENNKKEVEKLSKKNWVLGLSFWQRLLFLFNPDRRG